ncbi:MAG: hypothetical protein JXR52_02390 [Bacteroidales bacterium]|nr:hypothetical protein [Bacteroidales bacterium]MBN2697649.1 hypothetical protein [Bacteroidales bacterium]
MKQRRLFKSILIALLGILSVGAFYGGIALMIRPDGSLLEMPVELIQNSPFNNYLIPGIILLTVFGILIICIALLPQIRQEYRL